MQKVLNKRFAERGFEFVGSVNLNNTVCYSYTDDSNSPCNIGKLTLTVSQTVGISTTS